MEQRPLRLGDIVDDYCPRERRVTNHAIVAVVGDVIRQTRCTTCEAEHVYKAAKEPRLRKKPETSALYDQVLANVAGSSSPPGRPGEPDQPSMARSAAGEESDVPAGGEVQAGDSDQSADAEQPHDEGWPAHRQLIRATLPRTENDQPVPRPIPEFTMHQRQPPRGGRGFRFAGHGHGAGNPNANGNGNAPARSGFGPGRPGKPGRRHRGSKRPR